MNNNLFAEERLDKIKEKLQKDGKVIVKNLSKKFDVTEDCIRKDLKKLEKEGILKRTYGGGVSKRETANKVEIEKRIGANHQDKLKIAKKAFELINDKETIFLDISTTNILLAELIANNNKNITVITNMTDIISVLSNNSQVKIICPGGQYNSELDGFIGSMTIDNIIKYKPSKAFIGSCGVNVFDKEVTTFDTDDGNTKKAIIDSAQKVYIVMENRKFNLDGFYKFSLLDDIDTIITEEKPKSSICRELSNLDVNII